GNTGVASEVLLTVTSDPPPVVRILSPASGSIVTEGDTVQVSIEATDNAAVISTEFNVRDNTGQIIYTDLTNRRQFPFTIGIGATTYSLTAKATDNLGQTSTSTPVVLTIRPEPAPITRIVSPQDGSSVIEGAAVPITIEATDDVSVKFVSLDGAGLDFTAPYQFLLAAPPAFFGMTIQANAVDNVGKAGQPVQSSMSVLPDLRTTLEGTVVSSVNTPVQGAKVTAILNGLSAEVFNFNTPLTTLPDLTGRTPDKTKIISTPIGFRGTSDPFGFGLDLIPGRAVRFAGKIKIPAPGSYTFSLGVEAGGRLTVNGTTVIDRSNGTGEFQFGTGSIVLPAGDVPIELLTYYGQQLAVQLLYMPPGGEMQGIPPTMLSPALALYKTTSAANGRFTIPDVPTAPGDVSVLVEFTEPGGTPLSGRSNTTPPSAGGVTNVGPVVIAKTLRDVGSALSKLQIPGFANSVAVQGNYAYVAAGAQGLHIVDITDRTSPEIVNSIQLNGNANDVKVNGAQAYVAVGNAGLQVVDVSNPLNPQQVSTLNTGGEAWDLAFKGDGLVFVANGSAGLAIVDATAAVPAVVGTLNLPGISKGVDVEDYEGPNRRRIVVVARGANGLGVIDVADPRHPVLIGNLNGGDARDVVLGFDTGFGLRAFVADAVRGLTTVNLGIPNDPLLEVADPNDGSYEGVALAGNRAATAGNVTDNNLSILPIYDAGSTAFPLPRRLVRLYAETFGEVVGRGTGIALDSGYAYLTVAEGSGSVENGDEGSTWLYIAQYLADDTNTIPPMVFIDVHPLGERQTSSIGVRASDDVAVAKVTLSMNGQLVGTSSPLSRFSNTPFDVFIPAGVTSVILTATATDFANNTASTSITVPVQPYIPFPTGFFGTPNPTSMAFDGFLIWAAVPSFSSIDRINTLGPSLGGTITLANGSNPTYLAVDRAPNSCNPKCVWVANKGNNTVVKLFGAGVQLLTVNVTNVGNLVSDGTNVWVLSGTGTVFKIRGSDGVNLGTFSTGGLGSAYLAYDGANIWITNTLSNTVSKIRTSDGTNLGVFPTGNSPRGVLFDGVNIWVANRGSNNVSKIRASDGANLGTFSIQAPVQANPEALAYDGFYIWVANDSATWHVVSQLRASDGQHLADIDTGTNAKGILWDGNNLWVMNPEGIRRY
ncbi:MAG TPA: Ig-like domain-containing protein, partial [Terriglobia bacterium]|nr:Ig-like domain-containing protein [Terriglobia bacterium]